MSLYARGGKRVFDVLAATVVALLTAPLHALVAVLVALTSGRPIYFAQVRAGLDGKAFRLMKFRTMKVGTHEKSGGYPTADMLTTVGAFLRKTSLDELPQLINIIKGDMSVVGPRPAIMDQVARYDVDQCRRLTVRPGLTGLAQVRYRNSASWSIRIRTDLEYIETISLRGDLVLILRTVPAVLLGSGVAMDQTAQAIDDLGPPGASAGRDL